MVGYLVRQDTLAGVKMGLHTVARDAEALHDEKRGGDGQ